MTSAMFSASSVAVTPQPVRAVVRRVRTCAPIAVLALALAACGESTTAPGGEQELISRVTLTLTPSGGGTPITAYIDDSDGNGPQSPSAQVGAIALPAGSSYSGTILFENRLESPPENITEEVAAEAEEHRVFYTVTGAGLTVSTTDVDGDGVPLGLTYTVATGATPGTGALRVVLCHYDEDPKPVQVTSCTVDTDIDVTFAFTVTN